MIKDGWRPQNHLSGMLSEECRLEVLSSLIRARETLIRDIP